MQKTPVAVTNPKRNKTVKDYNMASLSYLAHFGLTDKSLVDRNFKPPDSQPI
jgi:hypothetical protein